MPAKNHVHKYELRKISARKRDGMKAYFCALPNCTHWMPNKDMVVGKSSICHQCGDEFIITKDITRKSIVFPRCPKCRGKVIATPIDDKLDSFLDGLI